MPFVDNIVFWRGTNSALIFTQQFGRWIRWDLVKFYDYVWWIKNLVWINNLIREIKKISTSPEEKITVQVENIFTEKEQYNEKFNSYEINIYDIIWHLQEHKESQNLSIANKTQIIMLYQQGILQKQHLKKREYKTFAEHFNTYLSSKYTFRLSPTWSLLKKILWIQEHITNTKDVVDVLEWKKITPKRKATLTEIQNLYRTEKIDISCLSRGKYHIFLYNFETLYWENIHIKLPRTWHDFTQVLGLQRHERTKQHVKIVLEWETISTPKELTIGTKEKAQFYYSKWIIQEEFLTSKKWNILQKDIAENYNIAFPKSFEWLMHLLLWKKEIEKIKAQNQKVPREKELALHLLSWKQYCEFQKKRLATKDDILSIKDELVNHLTDRKLKSFIKENYKRFHFEIPCSMNGLISAVWWDNNVSSSAKYFIHLLNGWWVYEPFEKPKATKEDIIQLIDSWEINKYDFSKWGWDDKIKLLEKKNLPFEIPKLDSLAYIITWVSKWWKKGKDYLWKKINQ